MNVCQTHLVEKRRYGKEQRLRCHKCLAEMVARSRTKFLAKLREERGNCCSDCNWNTYPQILQFHHRDPTSKEANVGNMSTSHKKMRGEAEKCDLLCPTCHAIRHLTFTN